VKYQALTSNDSIHVLKAYTIESSHMYLKVRKDCNNLYPKLTLV